MTSQRVEKIFTALDIGSSKVSAMIAGLTEQGEIVVLGTGQRASEGVKRGYIADMEKTELAVRNAVEQAERIAGVNIENVWVGCSSGGLSSTVATVEIELGGGRIEQEDIHQLLQAGRETIEPNGRTVLHAQPALYTLDGLSGVKKPEGLHADNLGVDIHVVLADGAPVRNMDTCVRGAHLNVKAVVASPIAAGMACLSSEERELGVALVELGAAVTNISLYAGGMLVGLFTIPYGGADITDAIASAFGIQRSQAERLKCFYGSATSSRSDHRDMIPVGGPNDTPAAGDDHHRIARAELISVIKQQLDYLIGEIGKGLKQLGFTAPGGRQIVLTGGGAELKGLADYVQAALDRTVRTGRPRGLIGLPEAHGGPAFVTLAGLIHYAAAAPLDIRTLPSAYQNIHKLSGGALVTRVVRALKAYF